MQAKDNLDAIPLNRSEDQATRIANFTSRLDASARYVLLLPAIIIVLVLAVFPLLVSLYLSFSVFKIVKGGFEIDFVGLANYAKLLTGSQQRSFLGRPGQIPLLGWLVLAVFAGFLIYMLYSYFRSPRFSIFGAIMRLISVALAAALAWLIMVTLIANDGLPGSLVVTLVFVAGRRDHRVLVWTRTGAAAGSKSTGQAFFSRDLFAADDDYPGRHRLSL